MTTNIKTDIDREKINQSLDDIGSFFNKLLNKTGYIQSYYDIFDYESSFVEALRYVFQLNKIDEKHVLYIYRILGTIILDEKIRNALLKKQETLIGFMIRTCMITIGIIAFRNNHIIKSSLIDELSRARTETIENAFFNEEPVNTAIIFYIDNLSIFTTIDLNFRIGGIEKFRIGIEKWVELFQTVFSHLSGHREYESSYSVKEIKILRNPFISPSLRRIVKNRMISDLIREKLNEFVNINNINPIMPQKRKAYDSIKNIIMSLSVNDTIGNIDKMAIQMGKLIATSPEELIEWYLNSETPEIMESNAHNLGKQIINIEKEAIYNFIARFQINLAEKIKKIEKFSDLLRKI